MKRQIVVHLVHGTWGRGFASVVREDLVASRGWGALCRILSSASAGPLWFEPGSEFTQKVKEKVAPALRDDIEFHEFLWSGSNSLGARAAAADGLRTHLQTEFSRTPGACHLLIAHSHGGVVAFNAVTRKGGTGGRQLDGILSLGTPYLAFEDDTENEFKLLMFRLLPPAKGLFFLALLLALALAGFHAAAVWLGAMIVGLFVGLRVIPRIANRPVVRCVADIFLVLTCAAAVWGGFSAAFSWVPLWHPAESVLGGLERAAPYPCRAIAACFSAVMLLASRAAAVRGPRGEAFMLRDTVASFLSLAVPVTICFVAMWAVVSQAVWLSNFRLFFFFWFIIALVAVVVRQEHFPKYFPKKFPSTSRREQDCQQTLAEEKQVPELPCPLDAVRLPGDEASLVIAASLIAREVANLPVAAFRAFAVLGKMPPWFIGLLSLLGVAAIVSGVHGMRVEGLQGWLAYLFGSALGIVGVCLLLLVAVLFLIACFLSFSLLTIGLLAIAVGPELTGILPAARVDCEPVPRCAPTDQCRFEL